MHQAKLNQHCQENESTDERSEKMPLDALFGKVDEYRQRKDQHSQEADLVSLDQEKIDKLVLSGTSVDDSIISLFSDVQSEIHMEQSRLDDEATELESIKQELVSEISEQISINDEVKSKAESLSGQRYTRGIDNVASKASEYISELQQMLDDLEVSSSDSSSCKLDRLNVSDETIQDTVSDTAKCNNNEQNSSLHNTNAIRNAKIKLNEIESWITQINPNYDAFDPSSPFCNNCGSCAFAVESRLNGIQNIIATENNIGTDSAMEYATGKVCKYMPIDSIEERLKDSGPGSHLIVGINRHPTPWGSPRAGHWFNAYYDGEKIYTLDGQTGDVLDWPYDYGDISEWCALI